MVKQEKSKLKNLAHYPLVEIIAELKWDIPQISSDQSTKNEELFMRFGSKISTIGYNRPQRLVHVNSPLIPFQPIYRYRNPLDTTLYQLGSGIFTTNITPPHQTWNDFRPIIERGIHFLLESDIGDDKLQQGTISLRYINAFKQQFTKGKTLNAFLKEILGFNITLPDIITQYAESIDKIKPALKLDIPLTNQQQLMTLVVTDGFINNEAAYFMDTAITIKEISLRSDALMNSLDSAHSIIHNIFYTITKKLHSLMHTSK